MNRIIGTPVNELFPPYRNIHDLLEESTERQIRPTGVYDAILADGGVTKNGRRFSRKDFINAQKLYFSNQAVIDKGRDPLNVSIADEFYPDGSLRLDRIIGQVMEMNVIDADNSWYVTCRFAVLDISPRLNPWYQTMHPLLTKLHGFYKAVPCGIVPDGHGAIIHENGVDLVQGFMLRSIMLSCNSGFEKADAVKPVFADQASSLRNQSGTRQPLPQRQSAPPRGSIFDRRRV